MRNKLVIGCAWLTLGMAAGIPARAAENIECATTLATPEVQDAVFRAYRAGQNIGEALVGEVGKDLLACPGKHGWSEEATESAIRVIFGEALIKGVSGELAAMELPNEAMLAAMERYIAALPMDERRRIADGDVSDEMATGLVQSILEDEVVPRERIDDKLAVIIGELASAQANATFFRAAFARQ